MIRFLLLSLMFVSAPAFAVSSVAELFHNTYFSGYEPTKCGANILGLVDAANKAGLDVRNGHVLTFTNHGPMAMGFVSAVHARNRAVKYSAQDPRSVEGRQPGRNNWYHHVVLELDGMIYDFDFGNRAEVVTVKDYFNRMFLEQGEKQKIDPFHKTRDQARQHLRVTSYSVDEYLKGVKHPKETKQSFGEYLDQRH